MTDLNGATAAITGGADGIGLALAKALGSRGARVALLDIRLETAKAAAAQLAADNIDARPFACDVADVGALANAARAIEDDFGGLNILCVNAGVGAPGNLVTAAQADIDWVFDVNLFGTLHTVRALYPLLIKTSGFRGVLFTASSITLGQVEDGPFALYASSKWAALGVAEVMAGKCRSEGINACIFSPGLLNTRIWDAARARPDRHGGAINLPDEAGALWQTTGMSPDWAAEAGVAALLAGQAYCAPVDRHSRDDFERRVAAVAQGFVIHAGPGEASA
jgi:NAD(P)-dependent dehydrogenase (short-subunit alcohol dehydrogenase family)